MRLWRLRSALRLRRCIGDPRWVQVECCLLSQIRLSAVLNGTFRLSYPGEREGCCELCARKLRGEFGFALLCVKPVRTYLGVGSRDTNAIRLLHILRQNCQRIRLLYKGSGTQQHQSCRR